MPAIVAPDIPGVISAIPIKNPAMKFLEKLFNTREISFDPVNCCHIPIKWCY